MHNSDQGLKGMSTTPTATEPLHTAYIFYIVIVLNNYNMDVEVMTKLPQCFQISLNQIKVILTPDNISL